MSATHLSATEAPPAARALAAGTRFLANRPKTAKDRAASAKEGRAAICVVGYLGGP